MKRRHTKEALKWIVAILKKHKIVFELEGGFASRVYGSKRKLADIDIQVKHSKLEEIPEIKDYITFGPKRYKDENWDLLLLTLNYEGQSIDISGLGKEKIFNKQSKKWENLGFKKSTNKKVYDIKVPVISVKDLVNYKKKLSRKVDRIDVAEILK